MFLNIFNLSLTDSREFDGIFSFLLGKYGMWQQGIILWSD